jgi:hypothetical protein
MLHHHYSDPKGGHKMSSLLGLFGRIHAALFTVQPAEVDPDAMSLQQWADLPVYHPGAVLKP